MGRRRVLFPGPQSGHAVGERIGVMGGRGDQGDIQDHWKCCAWQWILKVAHQTPSNYQRITIIINIIIYKNLCTKNCIVQVVFFFYKGKGWETKYFLPLRIKFIRPCMRTEWLWWLSDVYPPLSLPPAASVAGRSPNAWAPRAAHGRRRHPSRSRPRTRRAVAVRRPPTL